MQIEHIFMTYDGGAYNEATRTYDPISQRLINDERVKGSLVFDVNRRTIYAQGQEYGHSYTFPYVNSGTGTTGTDISKSVAYYVTGIEQNIDGSISYSYSYSYITFGLTDGGLDNTSGGAYITGLSMSDDGKITYKYASVNHVSTGTEANEGEHVLVNTYLHTDGTLSYTYVELGETSSAGEEKTLTYSQKLNVVTGIKQRKDGKISYEYSTLNTAHTSAGREDTDLDDYVITNVSLDKDGNFSYTYKDQTLDARDRLSSPKIGGPATITLIGPSTAYTFVTQVDQTSDGKVIYTYAYVNTTHSGEHNTNNGFLTGVSLSADGVLSGSSKPFTNYSNEDTSNRAGVVTYSYINKDGMLSYEWKDLTGSGEGDFMKSYVQDKYGHITGTFGTFTYAGDNASGPVYNINIDHDGKISYTHKSLSVTSGTNDGTKKLTNSSTYSFITSISQDSDGKVSYKYGNFQTAFSNSGTTDGVIVNVNIDGTGKLSYDSVDLSVNTGSYVVAPQTTKANAGTHIPFEAGTYTYFVTGISQDSTGKLSYTYSGIWSDAEHNYKWHEFSIDERTSTVADPQDDTVEVISTIDTSNSGNSKSHMMSYTTVSVATKKYVDDLMTANDALRYAGIVTPSSGSNGAVTFNNTDYSKGAVYKVSGNGYFGQQYVTGGDMVISNSDSTTASSFTGWDVINNNIDLRTNYNVNYKNTDDSKKVITNVYLNDSGLLSYTTYNIGVQTVSADDNVSNELLGGTLKVLNGVVLEQDGLDTRLSYTYTTIKVNKNHHSTVNDKAGGVSKVIGAVHLSNDGKLSYSYTDIAVEAYHYVPTAATNSTPTNSPIVIPYNGSDSIDITAYTDINKDTKHHVVGSTKTTFPLKHGVVTTNNTSIGQKEITIAAAGTVSTDIASYVSLVTDNGHLTASTYGSYVFKHGAPVGGVAYSLSVPVGSYINSVNLKYDANGHMTGYGFGTAQFVGEFTDEFVKFDAYAGKIYLSGTKTSVGGVTTHAYIDGVSYIQDKQLYTQVSYFNQSYVGQLNVSGTTYANGDTYIGDTTTDKLHIKSKNIDLDSDTKIEFTHLRALWGVIGE